MIDFALDLRNVEAASRVSEELVLKQMKQMELSLGKLESELQHHKKPEQGDKFNDKMKEFLRNAQGEFTRVQEQHKLMDRAFGELLAWFCIDRKKAPIDEFFGDLQNFLKDFDRAHKENTKIREQLAKQKRIKEQKDSAQQMRKQKTLRKRLDITGDDDKEGVLDDLLAQLSTGSAFDRGRRRNRKIKDEDKRPVLKKNESRSRENSNPAATPPRDADTAITNFGSEPEQAGRSPQDSLRAVLTGSATGRPAVEHAASGGVNGTAPSQAEMLLSNLRKQGNPSTSLGADAPSTML